MTVNSTARFPMFVSFVFLFSWQVFPMLTYRHPITPIEK